MDEFIKKYKKLLFMRKICTISYFMLMVLSFLAGLAGIITYGIHNQDAFLIASVLLCIAVPPVMIAIYLTVLVVGKDKKRKALDLELENSILTADEILRIGEALKIDLFYVALRKRAKELGIDRIPEWRVRDGILPSKDDLVS